MNECIIEVICDTKDKYCLIKTEYMYEIALQMFNKK